MNSPDEYLAQARNMDESLDLRFDQYRVRFVSNSKPLNKALADYYQHFIADPSTVADCVVEGIQCTTPVIDGEWVVKQPDPGKKKIKEHILSLDQARIVRKVQTGVHLFYVGDRRICAGPLEKNPNQVVNFINNMYLDHLLAPRGQLFHAAGACRGDFGIGMAGKSGKGKSTLALKLLERGLDLVSNDRLVVYQEAATLYMHGIPKYPRVNPGTVINQPQLRGIVTDENLARYESMSADDLWELEEKYDAIVEKAFGVDFRLVSRMRAFVALDWDRTLSTPTRLEKRDPGSCPELVRTIMKSPGVMLPGAAARIAEPRVEAYIELLNYCDFYALTGGVNFEDAADQVMALL